MKPNIQLNSIARHAGSVIACAAALTLGALVFSGCNSPVSQIVGHWKPDTSQPGTTERFKNTQYFAGLVLDITSDGRFTESAMGIVYGGTYKLDGRKFILHTDSFMGEKFGPRDKEPDQPGTLSDDGQTLALTGGKFMLDKGETLVFVKSDSK